MTIPPRSIRSLVAMTLCLACLAACLACLAAASTAPADENGDREKAAREAGDRQAAAVVAAASPGSKSSSSDTAASTTGSGTKLPPFADLFKDVKPIEGLIPLYRKDGKLYGELSAGNLNKDFIVLISIARGIGEGMLLGGMTWGFGDDWIWQFRKADDKIQIVRWNVRFTADKGSPEEKAVRLAYTDSVLFSLPVATKSPAGADVVDLSSVLMSDLPQISRVLKGFSFSRDKSSWAAVKGFKDNVEVEVAATYASSGTTRFDTVADSRGVTINVHYSISLLPETGYQPRLADDRVGYFLTVLKDYSKHSQTDRFVRYINRWDLRKADASADLSPPKKPIIFWLEKTVPFKYRKPIREGILEWNKAFEKIGFANAIEVRQQPDDADWDPEDINYNTFRWITSSAGLAMGPSRVNPTTGEILDADIIFDADFLRYWKENYEVFSPGGVIGRTGGPLDPDGDRHDLDRLPPHRWPQRQCLCNLSGGMARQLAFGSIALAAEGQPVSEQKLKELILQAIREAVMHEVGHTLGLRHNFKASTLLTLEEINDPEKTGQIGLAASVMDYLPINFAPKGRTQGDYFSSTIGPYDTWAVEYGYKSLGGGTDGETAELKKIAARCAEPALNYATDEDTRPLDPDPLANQFDLGSDPVEFARWRAELVGQLWPGLADRMTEEGEGYERVRRAFNILLSTHATSMSFAARFIGGVYVHRDHKGDPDGRPPFVVVEARRQREALELLQKEVFGTEAYQFPPELYNHLAPSKWSHWGVRSLDRVDYPVHEVILTWQDRILGQLLSSTTLSRLIDAELKVPPDQDAFTGAELLEELTAAIFRETEKLRGGKYTNRKPAIHSLRRSLQRRYLERLSLLAMGNVSAPEDCQTIAYAELEALEGRLKKVLSGKARLDSYTRAHLKESAGRIRKVLDAGLQLRTP